MKVLLLFAHADPSVAGKYLDAARRCAPDAEVDLRFINRAGLSSKYKQLAYELKDADGRVLPRMLDRFAPGARYDAVIGVSFSAGYALWREALWNLADSNALDGIVGIDSWHSGLDPDGSAADAQIAGLVRFALRAKERSDRVVCWLGHSDVDPIAYASTTKVAKEVARLAGGEDEEAGFNLEEYDVRVDPKQEHAAALTEWGPDFLGRAVAKLVELRGLVPKPKATVVHASDRALGRRILDACWREEAAGVQEIPGPKHHPRILEYLSGCMRNGKRLAFGADEVAWCAAAQGCLLMETIEPGEQAPHLWRCSVRENWADAIRLGTARSSLQVRSGEYRPRLGDEWIGTRGGPARGSGADAFAATLGKGHTGRICDWDDMDRFSTLDGNVGNKWTEVRRSVADTAFVGVIANPQPDVVPMMPDEWAIKQLGALTTMAETMAKRIACSVGLPLDC